MSVLNLFLELLELSAWNWFTEFILQDAEFIYLLLVQPLDYLFLWPYAVRYQHLLGDAHIYGITAWLRLGGASGNHLDQLPAQAEPPTARSQDHAHGF